MLLISQEPDEDDSVNQDGHSGRKDCNHDYGSGTGKFDRNITQIMAVTEKKKCKSHRHYETDEDIRHNKKPHKKEYKNEGGSAYEESHEHKHADKSVNKDVHSEGAGGLIVFVLHTVAYF